MTMRETRDRLFLTIDQVKEMSQRDPAHPSLTNFEAASLIYTCAVLHQNTKQAVHHLTAARMLFDLTAWPIPPTTEEAPEE
jgi:hypothetical protein